IVINFKVMSPNSRRDFIKKIGVGTAAISLGNSLFNNSAMAASAKSYRNIIGANERIRVATIGVNSRGASMSGTFARQKNTEVTHICDVDERAIPKAIKRVADAGQFFFSSRRRHTSFSRDWSSDVCSSDLPSPMLLRTEPLKH